MLSLTEILEQEKASQLPYFSLNDIDTLVTALRTVGKTDFDRVCISIKINKREVFFHAGSQTTNENNIWIRKKGNVVDMFDHSSLFEKAKYADNPENFYQKSGLSHQNFAIVGGGFPIGIQKTGTIGSLVVSGLTDEEDHDLAYQALLTLKTQLV